MCGQPSQLGRSTQYACGVNGILTDGSLAAAFFLCLVVCSVCFKYSTDAQQMEEITMNSQHRLKP